MLNLIEFQTVLCQAKDVVNSRPLSYVCSDISQPVTPNNFLRLRSINTDNQLEVTIDKIPITAQHLVAGWKNVNNFREFFWTQFRSLYLLNLRQFQNRFYKQDKGSVRRPLTLNEIVLIHDASTPRGNWRRGKITKIDNRQALATVLLPNRTFVERSIRHLYPLELNPVNS